MPKNISRMAALIPAKARMRKSRIGSIGFAARGAPRRRSRRGATAPATRPARTWALVQPSALAADQAVDDAEEADAGEAGAGHVEPGRGP